MFENRARYLAVTPNTTAYSIVISAVIRSSVRRS
jgi:hypothetical protein